MKILIHTTNNLKAFSEYFTFNQIEYTNIDLWSVVDKEQNDGQFILPSADKNQLVIIDTMTFKDILSCDFSYQHLLQFVNNNNLLWVGDYLDSALNLHNSMEHIKILDALIPHKSILLWMDAKPLQDLGFANIDIELNLHTFTTVPRIKNTVFTKHPQSYNFFITTVLKKDRPQRKILEDALQNRPALAQNSLVHFSPNKYTNYIGDRPTQHDFNDGFPSMDIYSNSFVEIAPETFFGNYHFLTEKTIKPIATKTPFLTLSTPGYLGFLRSLGFRTFGPLIDESYDDESDLLLRIEKMLDTLESIVKKGASNFYESSKSILDYNYDKLCELSMKKQSIFDHQVHYQLIFARKHLEKLD